MSTLGCRSCGAKPLSPILDLGTTPLANQLVTAEKNEPRFPLAVAYCTSCSLLQITETVPPEALFSEYVYFSSFSDWMLAHAKELTARIAGERRLGKADLVVEIASNDGYLLQFYKELGISVLGIEPARNIAKVAEEKGIPTLVEFFGRELGQRLRAEGRRAAVVHANNVMAHVPDTNSFAAGLSAILADEGIAIIEAPYVREMIERCEFDTIYHEHVFYFSLSALVPLFARHGLAVVDVEVIALHGGSLQVRLAKQSSSHRPTGRVQAMLDDEARIGMTKLAYYQGFSKRVQDLRTELRRVLGDLKAQGKRIAAYGAAAKGSTLLNYAGIGTDIIDYVVDRSPHKQNKKMPGVHLPIRPVEVLLEDRPDYVVLLAWNFKDEILRQQDAYRRAGGKFIVPVPAVSIV
jgi:hypothetical protein